MTILKTLIVIPARMASTRFPGKPLHKINGIAMLERVWRIAGAVTKPVEVVIATDSQKIAEFAHTIKADVLMTSEKCRTGMDRAAEAAQMVSLPYNNIITLQGDAVLTPSWVIDELVASMESDPAIKIATPAVKLSGETLKAYLKFKEKGSSTGTTVTFDKNNNALYFSKGIIPNCRNFDKLEFLYRHIGVYAYQKEVLMNLAAMPQSTLEKIENLEQLRALENGIAIKVVEVDYKGRTHSSVDNPEDIAITEAIINREGELF